MRRTAIAALFVLAVACGGSTDVPPDPPRPTGVIALEEAYALGNPPRCFWVDVQDSTVTEPDGTVRLSCVWKCGTINGALYENPGMVFEKLPGQAWNGPGMSGPTTWGPDPTDPTRTIVVPYAGACSP